MKPELLALVEHHREFGLAMTDLERAVLEKQIRVRATEDGEVLGMTARTWLAKALGIPSSVIACRELILRHEAGPLWARVEAGMSLYTARNLAKTAWRQADRSGATYERALQVVLAEYDTYPLRRTAEGKTFRKKPQGRPRTIATGNAAIPPKPSKEAENRADWISLRESVWRLVEQRIEGVPEMDALQLKTEFERGLQSLFDEMSVRLRRLRDGVVQDGERARLISRRALVDACRTLCMDPPKVGKPVDLQAGNRNKKRLARLYHPDAHGGSEDMRDRYEEVLAAYAVLEQFAELSNPKPETLTGDP